VNAKIKNNHSFSSSCNYHNCGFLALCRRNLSRAAVNIPVSFTIGADVKTTAFVQPFIDDKVQVEVTVQNGAALWQAQITSQSNVIWEHSAGQGEQTSYSSGWLELPSGSYNFTFRTVGVGSLNAVAAVSSKGGFW
jgi:hypothetical protein